ncbi:MAG: TIGR04255 family protein [Burkholderiales bacterium]
MIANPKLVIDTSEAFSHLPHAPIVEAVIDIRARSLVVLEEAVLRPQLETKLAGYLFLDSIQHFQIHHEARLQADAPVSQIVPEGSWTGLRFQSADKKQIAQFNRDGFVFSRLEPYESWEQLYKESMRLWSLYVELAHPIEIHRIGLRYINRIQLPSDDLRLEDYLEPAPVTPKGLDVPFHGFLHQDTLAVPGHAYAINVTRTIQPAGTPGMQGPGLILDIDAFTTQGFELDEGLLVQRLLEMRWLKNKVFYGSGTPKMLKLFQ